MSTNNFQAYAIALFDIAKTMDDKEKYYRQVMEIDQLDKEFPQLAMIFTSSNISKQEKKANAKELLEILGADSQFIYWMWAIIDNNDFANFHFIAKDCLMLHHEMFNIRQVKVITATELSQNQKDKIAAFLQDKLHTNIDLVSEVKPKVIGGISIQIGNKTYDNTIEGKLRTLKQALSKKG